jgi:uncharacterized protein
MDLKFNLKQRIISLFIILIFIFLIYFLVYYSPYKINLLQYSSYLIGIASGTFILYLNLFITKILKKVTPNRKNNNPHYSLENKFSIKNLYVITFIIFIGVLLEEILFRSYVIFYLSKVSNIYISIFISSILFTIIHYKGRHLEIFTMAIFYCIILLSTNNILTPIIAHFVNNYIIFLKKRYESSIILSKVNT